MDTMHQLRKAEIFVNTKKAALVVEKSVQWVRLNRNRFEFKRKNKRRNLEYELSSVLKVFDELKQKKESQYQVAS